MKTSEELLSFVEYSVCCSSKRLCYNQNLKPIGKTGNVICLSEIDTVYF